MTKQMLSVFFKSIEEEVYSSCSIYEEDHGYTEEIEYGYYIDPNNFLCIYDLTHDCPSSSFSMDHVDEKIDTYYPLICISQFRACFAYASAPCPIPPKEMPF